MISSCIMLEDAFKLIDIRMVMHRFSSRYAIRISKDILLHAAGFGTFRQLERPVMQVLQFFAKLKLRVSEGITKGF